MGVSPSETAWEPTVKGRARTSVRSSTSLKVICPSQPSLCVETGGGGGSPCLPSGALDL